MSSTEAAVPAAVRISFQLYVAAIAVSVLNAVMQVLFHLSPVLVLANPVIELALFVGIGLPMRAGRPWARVGMVSVVALIVLLNGIFIVHLTGVFGQYPTPQVVILLGIVTSKVALLAVATWMMYRPRNRGYFR